MAVTNDVVTDRRVARHAATLAEAGYDVVVVGREVWGAECGERSVGGGQWGVERLRLRNRRGWRFYAEMNWKLARWVPKQKPDIVWANDSDTLPGCYVAARMAGARLVMDAHELFPEVPEILHKPLVRWVWRTVERWLMPRCDARLTVCQSIADHYRRTLGVEMAVVRNISGGEMRVESKDNFEIRNLKFEIQNSLVDAPATNALTPARPQGAALSTAESNQISEKSHNHTFTQLPNTTSKVLLYQGAVNVGRGVDWAIDALEWLPECCLVVAGGGDLLDEMKRYAAQKAWADRVVFLGRLAPQELERLTPAADVGLVMLEDMVLSYHYALPNRIGDFVTAGVPMVVSDLPEMSAVVRRFDIGEVIENGELRAELLARAVKRVLERGKANYDFSAARADMDWNKEKLKLIELADSVSSGEYKTITYKP